MSTQIAPNVITWADDLDQETVRQATNVASMPFVSQPVAIMADGHLGYGVPIGTVLPTKGAIIPSAIGVDIGCGMIAVETIFKSGSLPDDLGSLHDAISQAVPAGMGQGHGDTSGNSKRDRRWHRFTRGLDSPPMDVALSNTAFKQFGSLGGGNHFVEVCLDESDQVWIVLHSGSRGVGNKLAQRHINEAKGLTLEKLTDPDLAYLTEGTPEFDAYIKAMLWAQAYAMENRQVMMDNVLLAFTEFLGFLPSLSIEQDRINCHHNFTEREVHNGETVWLTRKGAVKADKGDRGIIPGSMGTATYIVEGLGNPASYHSSSHGAGRKMSRAKARKNLDLDGLRQQMAGQAWNEDDAEQLLDEDPRAYKDIHTVMVNQADLVKTTHVLNSVLNYKGVS